MNTNANMILNKLKLFNQILIINNIEDYHEVNTFRKYINDSEYWSTGE